MATTLTSKVPAELGRPQSRSLLQPKSIAPAHMPNKIRRKGSFIRPDSSEDFPSSNDSIFEAFCFSASDDSGHKAQLIDIPSRIPRPAKRNDENSRSPSPSYVIDSTEFRYGNGTVLDTITEQRSFATIPSSKGRTKSADNSPSIPFLCHRDSFVLSKTPRRQISFSLDDIDLIKQSYHDACTVIEEACKPLLVHEIYAEPKTPIHAPPDRPPTPPGMPSWTEAQNAPIPPRRTSRPARQNLLQRLFNIPASPAAYSSPSASSSTQTRNRTVSAPVRGRTAPRFRPPKSVYGPIDQHPFATAPIAKVSQPSTAPYPAPAKPRSNRLCKQQRVRFTQSATARDSELNALQAAIESSTASAPHPFQPFQNADDPTITNPPKQSCTHRKVRGASVVTGQPEVVPSIKYTLLPPESLAQDRTQIWSPIDPEIPNTPQISQGDLDALCVLDAGCNCAASVSSTTFLMSGALRAPTPPPMLEPEPEISVLKKDPWCWKCRLQSAFGKLDQWWMKSAGCVCFVCCGFDIDEEGNVSSGAGSVHLYSASFRGGFGEEVVPCRIVVFNETPGLIL